MYKYVRVSGMLVGIPVLKNFDRISWERKVLWVAVVVSIIFVLFVILFNIFYTDYYPDTDWRQCCPEPCSHYPNCPGM